MNKKKLKYIIVGGFLILISTLFDLSFSKKDIPIFRENIEAMAENELNVLDLCKKSGGHCMVSITMDVYGISIEDQ